MTGKMENKFEYNYSAQQSRKAKMIREKYLPGEESILDELKKLDAKAKRPANVFGYTFGAVSAN